jgi:hypothetical protein
MILRITQTSSKFIRPSFASGADDNDLGLKNYWSDHAWPHPLIAYGWEAVTMQ